MIVLFEERKTRRHEDGDRTAEGRPPIGRASRLKARAIADVAEGRLSAEEACASYGLKPEELATWQRALQSFGLKPRRGKPDRTSR